MKIQINLTSIDYKKITLIKWILNAVVLLSGILLFVNSYSYIINRNGLKEIGDDISRLRKQEMKLDEELKKSGLSFSPPEMQALNKKITSVNSLLSKRTDFWTFLLSHLEAEVPKNISINSIKPHFTEGSIDLEGEAFSLKDLTDFIIKLEGSPNFKDVFLINQKIEGKEREMVTFSLKVKYKS
jgi:Tfp pilus assembly protein PilN